MNQQADGQAGGHGTGPSVSHAPWHSLFELWAEPQLQAHIEHPAASFPLRPARAAASFITGMSSESSRQVLIKH